jgi:hypothetical protein
MFCVTRLVSFELTNSFSASLRRYQQALNLCRRKHFVVVPVLETLRTSHAYTCAKGVQPSRCELPRLLRSHALQASVS